jgi:hypothetical protein
MNPWQQLNRQSEDSTLSPSRSNNRRPSAAEQRQLFRALEKHLTEQEQAYSEESPSARADIMPSERAPGVAGPQLVLGPQPKTFTKLQPRSASRHSTDLGGTGSIGTDKSSPSNVASRLSSSTGTRGSSDLVSGSGMPPRTKSFEKFLTTSAAQQETAPGAQPGAVEDLGGLGQQEEDGAFEAEEHELQPSRKIARHRSPGAQPEESMPAVVHASSAAGFLSDQQSLVLSNNQQNMVQAAQYAYETGDAFLRRLKVFFALSVATFAIMRVLVVSTPVLRYIQNNISVTYGAVHHLSDNNVLEKQYRLPDDDHFMQIGISSGEVGNDYAQLFVYDNTPSTNQLAQYFSIAFGPNSDPHKLPWANGVVGDSIMTFRSKDFEREFVKEKSMLLPMTAKERETVVHKADMLAQKVRDGRIVYGLHGKCERKWFSPRECDSITFLQHLFKLALPRHQIAFATSPSKTLQNHDEVSDVSLFPPLQKSKAFSGMLTDADKAQLIEPTAEAKSFLLSTTKGDQNIVDESLKRQQNTRDRGLRFGVNPDLFFKLVV